MIGLALSIFLGLILLAFGRQWQDAYHKSTAFLLWWNIAVTMFLGSILLSGTVFLASLGGLLSGATGFLIGLTGGGLTLSALMLFMVGMSCLQTLGAFFINNAVSAEDKGSYKWSLVMLSVGVILFTVGLTRIFG